MPVPPQPAEPAYEAAPQVAQPTPEGTEQLTLARIPLRDALALIDRGVISDAVSVIGLLRAARMLAAGELQAGDARSE